jgi:hypothetical protein
MPFTRVGLATTGCFLGIVWNHVYKTQQHTPHALGVSALFGTMHGRCRGFVAQGMWSGEGGLLLLHLVNCQ